MRLSTAKLDAMIEAAIVDCYTGRPRRDCGDLRP
jgi:hypothetical protein